MSKRKSRYRFFLVIIFTCFVASATAQKFSIPDSLNTKREKLVNFSALTAYPNTMFGLYELWYKDYPQTSFHFFDDSKEWLQMDKAGHIATAYDITNGMYSIYRWCGLDERKSTNRSMLIAMAYQGTIEVLDGFSSQWGFSWADFASNTTGTFLFYAQQRLWHEQRIKLKYSFHQTGYPPYRPNLLGKSLIEQPLKDYNGQTYWMSFHLNSFLSKNKKFPDWLCFAVGYGVDGLVGANSNPSIVNGETIPPFERRRQYYLGIDIDLSKIKTNHRWLHDVFSVINFIRLPLPAYEFNGDAKGKFYPLYF